MTGRRLPPPIGGDPREITQWVNEDHWQSWVAPYRPWWRQVEENVRMLQGRHYDQWIQSIGDFVDLSQFYASDDQRWRKYPVFNWVAHYYKLTLSKLTENIPVLGFLPATADERDARLAQVAEPIWKAGWHRMEMPEQMFRLYGWAICAARGIVKLRWNPDLGPADDYTAPAVVHLAFADGTIQTRELSDAPYVRLPDGSMYPHVQNDVAMQGDQPLFHPANGEVVFQAADTENGLQMGPPLRDRLGDLQVEIPSPVSIIVPHGPVPFHRKPWMCHEYLLHVDEARTRFGIGDLEPDEIPAGDLITLKLEYGTNYGMPVFGGGGTGGITIPSREALRDHVRIRELWCRDEPANPAYEQGRLTLVTKDRVLDDGPNPYYVAGEHPQAVLPFEAFDLISYPFRQEGTSDLEIINPLNRALDRRMGAMMDAADYNESTPLFINRDAGIEEDQSDWNRPGQTAEASLRNGDPVWRLPAAELPANAVEMARILQDWMQLLGTQPMGSEGLPVTNDASGELQREVRFDTDRVWGATLRLHSYGWARVAEKMIGIYAACMSDERMFTLAGEDQGWDFFTLKPELFQGTVHVVPQPESAVLETRQEKQNRLLGLRAVFPAIPDEVFLSLLGYPDLQRLSRPGGPAWSMAERENLEILLGQFPMVLPEHDHGTHILSHKRRMQTIEYRDAGPSVQARLRAHVALHEQFAAGALVAQLEARGAIAAHPANRLPESTSPSPSGESPSGPTPGAARTAGPTPASMARSSP